MAERTLRMGGLRITVEISDQLLQAGRRALRRASTRSKAARGGEGLLPPSATGGTGLVVRPPPQVGAEQRSPEGGLVFIQNRIDYRADRSRPPGPDEVPDGRDALARVAEARPWYHTIELPYGIVTAGVYDHRPLVPHYGIPAELEGKRVLDLASADGFWAFELERRGADVTALDIETTADVDLPSVVRRRAEELNLADPIGDGFALARRALGSQVDQVVGTIYDLDPDRLGQFDLVHAGDVLLHLRDPFLALEQIRRVTRGEALLSDVFDPTLPAHSAEEGPLVRYLGGGNANWWRPALGTLVQMVADAGFSDVQILTTYCLPAGGDTTGPWRAVLRARP